MSGFTDIAPVVREQTLKSVLVFVPKLSDRTINGELLRYLAKTANDEQPGIRTNTTICLGKIAKNLGTSSRTKVLIAAFTRSLRDPFVHARNAALMALAATSEYFTPEDIASRILPAICAVLLDKEKLVRDQSIKTMDIFMQRVRKAATALPDSALPPAAAAGDANGTARMSTPQPDASNSAASSWAGWAISSFTNKMSAAAGEIQTGAAATASPSTTPAAAAANGKPSSRPNMHSSHTSSASALHRQAVRSPSASQPMSRNSSTSNIAGESYFADAVGEDDADAAEDDAWGAMDDAFAEDLDEGNDDATAVDDDGGNDAWGGGAAAHENGDSTKAKKAAAPATSRTVSGGVHPFGDDDAEPDFAGWLAAQQEAKKKTGLAGKAPKGLVKRPATGSAAVAAVKPAVRTAAKAHAKPAAKVAAKKIDLAPKDSDDADGWGDGW